MKRVLITGSSGFIGRHCLTSLLSRGYDVHATTVEPPVEIAVDVHWYQTDLLDFAQIHKLVAQAKPTHLLHLAWYVQPGKYWTATENIQWLQASLELARNFALQGGQRVVMAGTCAEYDWRYGYCREGVTPTVPNTLYGVCKHTLQQTVQAFADLNQLSAAWGRIFFPYGPYEYPDRLIAYVIRRLLRDETAQVSDGNQIRDFLYVQDVADAFVALVDSDVRGPVNIGSGEPIALKTLFQKIAALLGRDMGLIQLGARPTAVGDPPLLVANVHRLRDEVCWRPTYDLEQGLRKTADWWAQHEGLG